MLIGASGADAVVDSSELGSYNGRFIQVFSYARLGGLHYAHPLDLVVMLARPWLCCKNVSFTVIIDMYIFTVWPARL